MLQKHFHVINAEHADQSGCPDLTAIKQLELLGALVEVVAQGDAVAPALDLPLFVQSFRSTGSPALSIRRRRSA